MLQHLYNKWGPSASNCVWLSRHPVQEGHYGNTVEVAVKTLVWASLHAPQFYDPSKESHILSIQPMSLDHDGRCCQSAQVATSHINRMILFASSKLKATQQITMYKNLGAHKCFGSSTGYLFETYVLAWLSAHPASKPLPCMVAEEYGLTGRLSALELPVSSPAQLFSMASQKTLHGQTPQVPFCLIPDSQSVGLNAIVCSQDFFFTVQVAISESSAHSISSSSFKTICNTIPLSFLKARQWCHVFVTDDESKAEKLRNEPQKDLPDNIIICSAVFNVNWLGSINERLCQFGKERVCIFWLRLLWLALIESLQGTRW